VKPESTRVRKRGKIRLYSTTSHFGCGVEVEKFLEKGGEKIAPFGGF